MFIRIAFFQILCFGLLEMLLFPFCGHIFLFSFFMMFSLFLLLCTTGSRLVLLILGTMNSLFVFGAESRSILLFQWFVAIFLCCFERRLPWKTLNLSLRETIPFYLLSAIPFVVFFLLTNLLKNEMA